MPAFSPIQGRPARCGGDSACWALDCWIWEGLAAPTEFLTKTPNIQEAGTMVSHLCVPQR